MTHKIYNFVTWIWYRILRRPLRLGRVHDLGNKKAKVLVIFLHGISATSSTWRTTIQQIQKDHELQNLRLVSFDLLGFGKSLRADWLDYSPDDYNQALNNSIKRLKPRGAIVLIGHSMGALIAANFANNYSEQYNLRELILVSPPLLMANELAKLPDRIYTKSYSSLHNFANEVPAAEVIAKLIQKFSNFRSDYIKSTAFEKSMDNIILNRKNYQTFMELTTPTLLVHGHFDPLVMSSNLKRAAKNNPRYIKYVSVIGHHDISAGKRAKIQLEIKKIIKEESNHATI